MKLAIVNNFKRLDTTLDKVRFIIGLSVVEFNRQRSYATIMTPLLVAGLYKKDSVIRFISTHTYLLWYIIPAWLLWSLFDILILLPGEQLFYSSSNKLFMDIHRNNKEENEDAV